MNTVQIIKTDNGFNTVLFVALAPLEVDRNGDMISEEEITKTAHDFMMHLSIYKSRNLVCILNRVGRSCPDDLQK